MRIRLALFKLCETLYRPKDESVPKLKFRLPASAAPAAAPAAQGDIPRIKLVSSGQRTKPGDPTVVPYDELENSAVVQPSALAGVPQPEAFNSRTNKSLPQPNKKKSKAPKEPHRSQASGMTTEDVQACRSLHAKMLKDPISAFFRQPVDPARDGAPGYFERVHRPMDLMTMNAKLQAGQYSNRDQFREDFEQIVRNTEMYNGMEHNITRAAKQMESKFRKQWNRIDATLRRKHERDLANGNGNVTVRPSGKGDAALSIDQTFSQPPTQQFKIKLAGAQHGNANEPPSKEALDRSATVPLPTAAAPPKTKLKLSFGPSKPQPPSAMAASPAERAMSPQRQIKKVKIAAPNAPLPPAVEPEAGPSTSVSSAEPNGISSSAPVLPTQDEVTVIESTRVQPTTASEAEAATSTQAMDEQLPPVQEPAPAEAAASFDAAPLPALGQMQPSPQLPVTASTTSAPPSAAPPAPAISAPPAPAIGAPSQPPPVKINIKKPMIKIKPAKPPPPPAVQPSAPKPPAPAPVAGPSRSPSLPASTQEPPVKKKETSDKAGEDESGVSTDPLDDHQRTKNILTHIWNQTEATWFRYPVDPVTSGCPT